MYKKLSCMWISVIVCMCECWCVCALQLLQLQRKRYRDLSGSQAILQRVTTLAGVSSLWGSSDIPKFVIAIEVNVF